MPAALELAVVDSTCLPCGTRPIGLTPLSIVPSVWWHVCRVALSALFCAWCCRVQAVGPFPLWPGTPPGDTQSLPAEADQTKPDENQPGGKRLIRLSNVSTPLVEFFPAPHAAEGPGACVLVCPGGGYNILAYDLEGSEVCEYLNSVGVSAAVLKYRVPRREGRAPHDAPLQDAQRAMGLLRSKAKELQFNPDRLGILGFSAGGHLTAMVSASGNQRTYPKVDAADDLPCLPNFTCLIYPAYLVQKEHHTQLVPEFKPTKDFPPAFIAMTQDDAVDPMNALIVAQTLTELKVPVSLHLFPSGGHGYGLRKVGHEVETWPELLATWLRSKDLAPSK